MSVRGVASPPRPVAAGDVLTAFSEELGEWAAVQILGVRRSEPYLEVVELDWSAPQPPGTVDRIAAQDGLRPVGEAVLVPWVVPRSHLVVGRAPLVQPAGSGLHVSWGWWSRSELNERRRLAADPQWDARSIRDQVGETRLHRALSDRSFRDAGMLHLTLMPGPVHGPTVDCARLVNAYPNLVSLSVAGIAGRLEHAGALNALTRLRLLELTDIYEMTAADVPDPARMPMLEGVALDSVPADYLQATKRAWKPLADQGVYLSLRRGRTPEWVVQNRANPLRGWDGRLGVPARGLARARAAWNQVTPAILQALDAAPSPGRLDRRLAELGIQFAHAFDEVNQPSPFIHDEEREELLVALANLVSQAPAAAGLQRQHAIDTLIHSVNQHRSW